jgi:hypothetical protein
MKSQKKKDSSLADLQNQLSELEAKLAHRGICVHYDRLEAAGFKIKGGLCKIKGEYHLFVDKRMSETEKIEILGDCVNRPLTSDIPELGE